MIDGKKYEQAKTPSSNGGAIAEASPIHSHSGESISPLEGCEGRTLFIPLSPQLLPWLHIMTNFDMKETLVILIC